ncbi:hypothetical protein ACH5RR_015920 [Cinchona calisaya]|uniref:Uncharacterized protein n=1 Tax=Cinchona calisaya TaxID=153742 RepID=A0ABD2ZUJ7_9GENT
MDSGKEIELYLSHYYIREMFLSAYEPVINPINSPRMRPDTKMPPLFPSHYWVQLGRPKNARKRDPDSPVKKTSKNKLQKLSRAIGKGLTSVRTARKRGFIKEVHDVEHVHATIEAKQVPVAKVETHNSTRGAEHIEGTETGLNEDVQVLEISTFVSDSWYTPVLKTDEVHAFVKDVHNLEALLVSTKETQVPLSENKQNRGTELKTGTSKNRHPPHVFRNGIMYVNEKNWVWPMIPSKPPQANNLLPLRPLSLATRTMTPPSRSEPHCQLIILQLKM